MKILFLGIALMPFCLYSQNTILVRIHNVESTDGTINVAAYSSDDTFLSMDRAVKGSMVSAHKGIVTLKIEDLPLLVNMHWPYSMMKTEMVSWTPTGWASRRKK